MHPFHTPSEYISRYKLQLTGTIHHTLQQIFSGFESALKPIKNTASFRGIKWIKCAGSLVVLRICQLLLTENVGEFAAAPQTQHS